MCGLCIFTNFLDVYILPCVSFFELLRSCCLVFYVYVLEFIKKNPYECQNAYIISQWIEDSVTNLSVWTTLSSVLWMAGFTPLEDIEKHWCSWKREKYLFLRPSIKVLIFIEVFKYINWGFVESSIEVLLNPWFRVW